MKANELMIGDWVHLIDTENCIDNDIQWTSEDYAEINADYCEPIYLNAEILKANGFESASTHSFQIGDRIKWFVQVYLYDNLCIIHIIKKVPNGCINHICLNCERYVHILQHALRLCGLNDLADNFKI